MTITKDFIDIIIVVTICFGVAFLLLKKYLKKFYGILILSYFSIIWLTFIILLSVNQNNVNNINTVNSFPLNNWGDFLAGFVAPILFIWVVYGIFIQKSEFSNAIDEYKKSVEFLKKQSINEDIQHKNTWFDRNADMLEKYIDLIINQEGPLNELNTKIIGQNIYTFRKILFDILNIVELNQYIITSLKNSKNHEESYNEALKRLETEYDILFGKNILSSKRIACKFYLHIYRSKKFSKKNYDIIEHESFKSFYNLDILSNNKIIFIDKLMENYDIEFSSDNFIDIIYESLSIYDINEIIFEEKINEEVV